MTGAVALLDCCADLAGELWPAKILGTTHEVINILMARILGAEATLVLDNRYLSVSFRRSTVGLVLKKCDEKRPRKSTLADEFKVR